MRYTGCSGRGLLWRDFALLKFHVCACRLDKATLYVDLLLRSSVLVDNLKESFGRLWSGFGLSCDYPFTGVVGGSDALHCIMRVAMKALTSQCVVLPSIVLKGVCYHTIVNSCQVLKDFQWETYTPSVCSGFFCPWSSPGLSLRDHPSCHIC